MEWESVVPVVITVWHGGVNRTFAECMDFVKTQANGTHTIPTPDVVSCATMVVSPVASVTR
jgi:hypothetical protein